MYRLRELEEKDLPIINQWRNDPELVGLLASPYRYINLAVDENWFANYMANRSSAIRCSIVDSQDNILGLVSLTGIDSLNQSAEFHIMIGEKRNRGKGVGTFALKTMLNHAFFHLNLRRIELAVLDSNKSAQYLYEKSGFVKEGTMRQAVYKEGKFVDVYFYSILKEEFTNSGGGYFYKIILNSNCLLISLTWDNKMPVHKYQTA